MNAIDHYRRKAACLSDSGGCSISRQVTMTKQKGRPVGGCQDNLPMTTWGKWTPALAFRQALRRVSSHNLVITYGSNDYGTEPHRRSRSNLKLIFYGRIGRYPSLSANLYPAADFRAGDNERVFSHHDVVSDVNMIVDLGATLDYRIVKCSTTNGGQRADLDIIFDQNPTEMG